MKASICSIFLFTLLTSAATQAEDQRMLSWASFRNGGSSRVIGKLPTSWSPSNGGAWQVELDGYGQSTPIIMHDLVYVTSVIGPQKQECAISAIDLATGETRWQSRFKAAQLGTSNYMYSRGAPTPVADATGVFGFFESGDLVAVKSTGQRLWHRNLTAELGPFQSNHGLGSSLAHSTDLLLLNLEHKGPSKLIAVRKSDGYIAWQVDRPSGSSWTSPVVTRNSVVVSSAGELAAYSLRDGARQWSIDGLEGNSVPSPCVIGDRVYAGARIPEFGSAADASRSNICVKLPESESDSAEVLWRSSGAVCDYASPVVDEDRVYFLNKVGVLSCLNADSGESLFRTRLGTECWATPIVADNGIYFFGKRGTTKVIARGPEFQLLQTNNLWDPANPPAPETYREAERSAHAAHGSSSESAGKQHGDQKPEGEKSSTRRGPGGMIAALMSRDANKDGILQEEEISADFRPMLKRIDTNGDGALDSEELNAMAKSFAERRKNSRNSSRDPIVYGVAAVADAVVVRTGTRLYCLTVASETDQKLSEVQQ